MIPSNNPEKFIKEFGNWWYLREFDYFPEGLEYYNRYLSEEAIDLIRASQFADRKWAFFTSLKEAREASNCVRKSLGLKELFIGENLEPIWTPEGRICELQMELQKNEDIQKQKDGD